MPPPTEDERREEIRQAIAGFAEKSVKFGSTTFTFRKMSAWRGFEVLESLRPGLVKAFGLMPATGMTIQQRLVAAFASIPRETVKEGRSSLFEFVDWVNDKRGQPVKLVDREDEAFDGLEAIHVYQVLLRAFAVNFTGSLDELIPRVPPNPNTE